MFDRLKSVLAETAPELAGLFITAATGGAAPVALVAKAMVETAIGSGPQTPDALASHIRENKTSQKQLAAMVAERHAEIAALRIQAETEQVKAINETMRAEYASKNRFAAGWRPTIGYVLALQFGLVGVGMAILMLFKTEQFAGVATALEGLIPLFAIQALILGVNIKARSDDKKVSAGAPVGLTGGLATLMKAMRGGK